MQKSKYIYTSFVILGISILGFWSINRLYQILVAVDSIERVEISNTKAELKIQRLSTPRAGDIYLIAEANDSFSFFQIGNVDSTYEVPIIKGAYEISDSFLLESTIEGFGHSVSQSF